jgi:hypothetical protein
VTVTLFAPFFFLLFVYAWRGERQWALASIVGSFLQAASPILVGAGGRIVGFQTAYVLLPLGVLHILIDYLRRSRRVAIAGSGTTESFDARVLNLPDALLIATTVVGVGGAYLLPRVFSGVIHVLPADLGARRELLHSSSRNIIQSLYMISNLALYLLISRSLIRRVIGIQDCMRALAFGAWCVIALGIYQVAAGFLHLPWPSPIINSNLGYAQLYNQGALGLVRMSSTFVEPSVLAMHLLGLFALFGIGCQRRWLGGALLGCLLISTSATAYVGSLMLLIFCSVHLFPRMSLRSVALLSMGVAVAIAAATVALINSDHLPGMQLVMLKLHSQSGAARTGADLVNLEVIRDSWGLGAGIGSTRSSSFLVTYAACTGLPGVVCLISFIAVLVARAARSASVEVRALGLGLIGMTLGWLISIPDLTLSMLWLLAAMIRGATALDSGAAASATAAAGFRLPQRLRPVAGLDMNTTVGG